MILVVRSKMLPKSHCMLKAKNLSFIFLEEAFSNSCEEIHTFNALNIDSVKINTSLIMMREWVI